MKYSFFYNWRHTIKGREDVGLVKMIREKCKLLLLSWDPSMAFGTRQGRCIMQLKR